MEESLNGQAHLKEVDAETFSLFVEFLYTRDYRVTSNALNAEDEDTTEKEASETDFPPLTPAMETIKSILVTRGLGFFCHWCCRAGIANSGWFPHCQASCYDDMKCEADDYYCIACGGDIDTEQSVCDPCLRVLGLEGQVWDLPTPRGTDWVAFKLQKFRVGKQSPREVAEWLQVSWQLLGSIQEK